jgi:hypothetical protein
MGVTSSTEQKLILSKMINEGSPFPKIFTRFFARPLLNDELNFEEEEARIKEALQNYQVQYQSIQATSTSFWKEGCKSCIIHYSLHGARYEYKRCHEVPTDFEYTDQWRKLCDDGGCDEMMALDALIECEGNIDNAKTWIKIKLDELMSNDKICFEHPCNLWTEGLGRPVWLTAAEIQEKHREFRADMFKPKLVFVAACHSQAIGNVFVTLGAQHVVAVERYNIGLFLLLLFF